MDFSVCVELAFAEGDRPLDERVRAAAESGFPAVEIWDWRGKPVDKLKRALLETGISLHTLCVEDWRDKCQLGDPNSHAAFLLRVAQAADVASDLGTNKLVVLAGNVVGNADLAAQRAAAADVLARAADAVAGRGLELLLEVVNRAFEGPNALIADSASAIALLRSANRPNLKFLYDRYHAILNGEAMGWGIDGNMDLVGHIQVADIPGRHEFGTGNVDWAAELRWLADRGYSGLIGIEATPLGDSRGLYAGAQAVLAAATAS
jgi:hydroxypyruvate isomerase